MTKARRKAIRWALALGLLALAGHQLWRHGRHYVFAENFAVVVPEKVYRGAWQRPWPMRRIVKERQIKTIVALAHAPGAPLPEAEKALAQELGVKWAHVPIVDERTSLDGRTLAQQLDEAADLIADPKNQPVFFHCHHGINRASMAQMAYRIRRCGWTFEQAVAEIDQGFGFVSTRRGPDFEFMRRYAGERAAMVEEEEQEKK